MPPPQDEEVQYLGHVFHVQPPPLACAAILVYFACLEKRPLTIPDFIPRNRADANALGWRGATQEDAIEYQSASRVRFPRVRHTDTPPSAPHLLSIWQMDRQRFIKSSISLPHVPRAAAYKLGSLTGRWAGSIAVRHLTDLHL
jgi:hypothetical protein